ncbi:MAG: hypothetical protein LBU19_03465 [Treponema sp.]|nr:hypothetical protein [Treponema sp.]
MLTLDNTHMVDLTARKVIEVISKPQKLTGRISGKHHDWVNVNPNNEMVKSLLLVIDGPGGDTDTIGFDAQLNLQFTEINPAWLDYQ